MRCRIGPEFGKDALYNEGVNLAARCARRRLRPVRCAAKVGRCNPLVLTTH